MARITVEDCLRNVKNRFELVMLAAKRARQLMRGSVDPTVPWENDKATVVALREIASGHTKFDDAHEIDLIPKAPQPIVTMTDIEMDIDDHDDDMELGAEGNTHHDDEAETETESESEHKSDEDEDEDTHSEFHETDHND